MTRAAYTAACSLLCLVSAVCAWSQAGLQPAAAVNAAPGVLQPGAFLPDALPYRMWNGLIVVPTTLPNGLAYPAAIGTALPICFLSPRVASLAGAQPSGVQTVQLLDRAVSAGRARPLSLRVGRVGVDQVETGVLDLYSTLSGQPDPMAPAVWLGATFLRAVCFCIDPVKQEIAFRRPTDPFPGKCTLVPFELKDGRMSVEVKVNGKRSFRAIVDTAAIGMLLPAAVARELALPTVATVPATLPNGKDGKVSVVELDEVDLGGAKVQSVRALYVADAAKDAIDPDLAIIGNDVLLRFRFTVNYRDCKLALERIRLPGPAPDVPSKEPASRDGAGPGRPAGAPPGRPSTPPGEQTLLDGTR